MAVNMTQVMARITLDERAEIEALADMNGINSSELIRQAVELAKAEFRRRGEERLKQLELASKHGVTTRMEDEALEKLIQELNRGDAITLEATALLSPKSKAVFRFLSIVWQQSPGELSQEVIELFALRVKSFSDPTKGDKDSTVKPEN
jgi:hypothetical protein